MAILLSCDIQQAMLNQAENGYPYEICGLVFGRWQGEDGIGYSYHPCGNNSNQLKTRRFLIDPAIYQDLEDQADEQDLSIISIVHSHPDHPDQPSEFDRTHAWPGLSYIIIAVVPKKSSQKASGRGSGRVVSRASWRLRLDRSGFDREDIIVEAGRK